MMTSMSCVPRRNPVCGVFPHDCNCHGVLDEEGILKTGPLSNNGVPLIHQVQFYNIREYFLKFMVDSITKFQCHPSIPVAVQNIFNALLLTGHTGVLSYSV